MTDNDGPPYNSTNSTLIKTEFKLVTVCYTGYCDT